MRISDWSSDVCSSDLELRRGHHLFEADRVAEDGERIVRRVAARLHRDFGEGFVLGAITLLIVAPAAAEELRRPWRLLVLALDIVGDAGEAFHRGLTVDRKSTRLNSSH